ncbi:MAG: hypothetical protein HZB70_02435 [Candidatus Berkelbacteria bacterium]|nr:MAG: hypothetical protein HZB70_02435 [Candidatus Berkelbacteria bacterium]QQG51832.1 MAG: hypothetical protein HY845_00560 [Candidatus Berkelbacteria bacterium]
MKLISTRATFIIVSLVTIALLAGSVILQQIVFRAEQEFSALTLSPTTFRVAQGQPVDLSLNSISVNQVIVSGLQVKLGYEAAKLTFKEAVPPIGWQTLRLASTTDTVDWILAPITSSTSLVTLQGEVKLGTVRFLATGAGVTNVTVAQESTVLSAVDQVRGSFVYNAAESVQDSAGTITAGNVGEITFPEAKLPVIVPEETDDSAKFGTQRIVSSYVETSARAGLVFVTLASSGKVTVEFGPTPALGNKAETTRESATHVINLSSLDPNQQYYYRVLGEETQQRSRVVGALKTFKTTAEGTGTLSAGRSKVVAFPAKSKQTSTLFIFPRDDEGKTVESAGLTVEHEGDATLGQVSTLGGYYVVEVTTATDKKQAVKLTPKVGETALEARTVVLDPEYKEPTVTLNKSELVLAWNDKTMAFLFGGAILLFLLLYFFVRLARSR